MAVQFWRGFLCSWPGRSCASLCSVLCSFKPLFKCILSMFFDTGCVNFVWCLLVQIRSEVQALASSLAP